MNVRSRLREATSQYHERVDSLFGQLDLGAPTDYASFLAAQAAAYLPVEAELDGSGIEEFVPDWKERRRANLLLRDLKDLGISTPPPLAAPDLSCEGAALGALYVLEGSRLGGKVLRRQISPVLPQRFLAAEQPKGSWPKLLELLNETLYSPERFAAAVSAARAVFELFETAGRQQIQRLDA